MSKPLAGKLGVASLRVDGLQLHAARDGASKVNLLQIVGSNRAAGGAGTGARSAKSGLASKPAGGAATEACAHDRGQPTLADQPWHP